MTVLASRWLRDFDSTRIGLLYYVMACSQTLGDALKRIARYSKIANEALVFDIERETGSLSVLSYSGVSAALRQTSKLILHVCCITNCRVLTG